MVRQWFLQITIAVLSLFLLNGCEQEEAGSLMTKDQVEALVSKGVQIGAPREVVVSFLNANKIEYSDKRDESVIYAMVWGGTDNEVVRKSFSIKFEFDATEKLAAYSVTEKLTGP